MLQVSTCAITSKTDKPEEILSWLDKVGAEAVELEYRIREETFPKLKRELLRAGIKVLSLHNFCPLPEAAPEPSGDAFLFTSDDPDERLLAVRATINTLEQAADLEACAVVLHLGYVPLREEVEAFTAKWREEKDGPEVEEAREKLKVRRWQKAPVYLDRVFWCLDRILQAAMHLEVQVGIENRYYYHEIPLPEEVEVILNKFAGAPLGYWHDVGHAHHLEVLGLARQEEILERYQNAIIGVHLHDAVGEQDHLPPGSGEIDLARVLSFIPARALKVVEVAKGNDIARFREGLDYLRRLLNGRAVS
ncbi:Xylose isomerase domain protein TIM barrel [Ammonifex degensii KC4]|uniref:Xylose isomerase domain protein TIM barrel n=1 Tax=Ammonifex degensii (strain DSM 10501 / KC4) TaxID=429009 RepID=C9RB61_AMMDK|nr:sugar phosphate isomerase/epimerase [Ammonifex degensii]ACX51488.1 Xylose isomerase domain protein TIM barrel [Ammonifex degensii KC4]